MHRQIAKEVAGAVPPRRDVAQRPQNRAILPAQLPFLAGTALPFQALARLDHRLPFLVVHEIEARPSDDLLARVAQHIGHALVDIGNGPVGLVGGNALFGRLDDPAVALLALAQRLLRSLALGDNLRCDGNAVRDRSDRGAKPVIHPIRVVAIFKFRHLPGFHRQLVHRKEASLGKGRKDLGHAAADELFRSVSCGLGSLGILVDVGEVNDFALVVVERFENREAVKGVLLHGPEAFFTFPEFPQPACSL